MNRKLRNAVDFDIIDIQVPWNIPYKKYGTIPLVPKTDVNLCTECKACAKACPAGAISMENPKKTDKKKCISCMKCVYSCKKKARYVSNMKLNMAQKKLTKSAKAINRQRFSYNIKFRKKRLIPSFFGTLFISAQDNFTLTAFIL